MEVSKNLIEPLEVFIQSVELDIHTTHFVIFWLIEAVIMIITVLLFVGTIKWLFRNFDSGQNGGTVGIKGGGTIVFISKIEMSDLESQHDLKIKRQKSQK